MQHAVPLDSGMRRKPGWRQALHGHLPEKRHAESMPVDPGTCDGRKPDRGAACTGARQAKHGLTRRNRPKVVRWA